MLKYKSILNPFPEENKIVYGKVIKCEKREEEDIGYLVEISLTNYEMIRFDYNFYSDYGLLDKINKYLIEPSSNLEKKIKSILTRFGIEDELNWLFDSDKLGNLRNTMELKEKVCSIYNSLTPYFYEFSGNVSDRALIQNLLDYHEKGGYYEFTLLGFSNQNSYSEKTIKGQVLFSASPIEVKKAQLVIVEKRVRNKFLNHPKANRSVFQTSYHGIDKLKLQDRKSFHRTLAGCLPQKIHSIKYSLYHIGQGLCSYMSFNRNFGLFYDVGFSEYGQTDTSIRFNNSGEFTRFKNRMPQALILSHWDLDHILGVVYCHKEVYNRIWIAPNINQIKNNSISNSALRLSKYLSLKEGSNNLKISRSSKAYRKTLFLIFRLTNISK
jgi:hypothetical protein